MLPALSVPTNTSNQVSNTQPLSDTKLKLTHPQHNSIAGASAVSPKANPAMFLNKDSLGNNSILNTQGSLNNKIMK